MSKNDERAEAVFTFIGAVIWFGTKFAATCLISAQLLIWALAGYAVHSGFVHALSVTFALMFLVSVASRHKKD
jgi:hypothetical protein